MKKKCNDEPISVMYVDIISRPDVYILIIIVIHPADLVVIDVYSVYSFLSFPSFYIWTKKYFLN